MQGGTQWAKIESKKCKSIGKFSGCLTKFKMNVSTTISLAPENKIQYGEKSTTWASKKMTIAGFSNLSGMHPNTQIVTENYTVIIECESERVK